MEKRPTRFRPALIEKRGRLLEAAANYGVDLRTAALQFSAAPDVACALVVGCRSEQQILADHTSMQTNIPYEFWTDLSAESNRAKRASAADRARERQLRESYGNCRWSDRSAQGL